MYLYSAIAVTLRRRNATLSRSSTKDNDQGKREAVKMKWYIEVDFNICAVLYIIMAVTSLQDEVPMACLDKGVIWCFALCGLKFTSFVNPSMCFTVIESYRRGIRKYLLRDGPVWRRSRNLRILESRDEDEEIYLLRTLSKNVVRHAIMVAGCSWGLRDAKLHAISASIIHSDISPVFRTLAF